MGERAKPVASTVTRDDVARLAGVSPAVVSYVVNGTKRLTPETTARVNDAIAKLGYRPNRAARSLRLGSSETLGIVLPDTSNAFFMMLSQAVELAAADRGHGLLVVNSDGTRAGEAARLDRLAARGVDGLILCSSVAFPDVKAFGSRPLLLLNQYERVHGVHTVGVDLLLGAKLAVEHLADHGHRRIGLLAGETSEGDPDARETGWVEAVSEHGLQRGPVARERFSAAGGYLAAQRLIEDGALPSAFFVASDQMALGMLRAFHEHGIRVPEDIAIVSFDNVPDSAYSWPPLATIAQPLAAMGSAAVDALLSGEEPRRRLFVPSLVRRVSCGCQPGEGDGAPAHG